MAVAALKRMRVSGLATSSSSSVPNWKGGVSMVQGASRGIGLEFLLENNKNGYVVATCRNPKEATSLSDLKNRFSERLFIQKLDVTDETTIEVVSTLKSVSFH
ncbi:hypothetical protein [Arabidopsis thaliana]|uniref:Uncharacterized protein AT4g20750 n=1 Tax=Arabidopsis thaliana TaxID=3702 RepID=Q9SVH2_ARATH|nr:hypothetical protein [Arabidopsis thaliana]CAB79075.1 hypothetical protein [Arabidopsis thaliana]